MDSREAFVLQAELRHGNDPMLRRRRTIAGLSIFSTVVLGGIALFQLGIAKKLPDPPLPAFDADRVNGSLEAYGLLETPDALLGMASYAVTACLAGMGGQRRRNASKWIPIGMAAKAAIDAAQAARLSAGQWTKYRRFSLWSLLVAGATFASLPLAVPEARSALSRR